MLSVPPPVGVQVKENRVTTLEGEETEFPVDIRTPRRLVGS